MEARLISIMGGIAGIGGLALGVLLILFFGVIQQRLLFQTGLSSIQSFFVIIALLILTFSIAVIGILAGVVTANSNKKPVPFRSLVLLAVLFGLGLISTVALLGMAIAGQAMGDATGSSPKGTARPTPKVTRVCMGEGGGNNCLGAAEAKFNCDVYYRWGAGGKMTQNLGENFCTTTANGSKQQQPFDVQVFHNTDGGKCGWTGYTVTCNP
jgi:hypothetical protein